MDINRMKKAELIELNGQLNEAREHCDVVIEALRAELAAVKAELEQAYAVVGALKLGIEMPGTKRPVAERPVAERPVAERPAQAHRVSQSAVRNNKLVHEFDPDVQGSYLAAMRRARELGGVVRRARP